MLKKIKSGEKNFFVEESERTKGKFFIFRGKQRDSLSIRLTGENRRILEWRAIFYFLKQLIEERKYLSIY